MIERKCKKEVLELVSYFPVIGILGPRQVGKTTFVKQLMKTGFKKCVYLDLEKPSDYEKLAEPEIYFEMHREECVIIDEIQIRPELFAVLRAEIDVFKKPARFIILGSASPDIVRESSESLAGRVSYVHMHPLTLAEVNQAHFRKHHFYGGFPDSYIAPTDFYAKKWLDDFIKTYIERDLPLLGLPAAPVVTRRLWEMLAWQNGNLLNLSSIGKSLGVSYHTIKSYMGFIEGSFMIQTVRPFSPNIKKSIVKSPKVYICDTGVLHRLLKIPNYDSLLGMPVLGASFEAYVLQQLSAQKPEDIEISFYRTRSGTEIDFVLSRASVPVAAIEVKFSSVPKLSKGFRNGISDLKTENNFILVPKSESFMKSERVKVCGIVDFLRDELPLL